MDITECPFDSPGCKVCQEITYYPTFCCKGDDTCSHKNNLQESFTEGENFDKVLAAYKIKCENRPLVLELIPNVTFAL